MAHENLKLGVSLLQYDTEFEDGESKDKKGAIYSVRALSTESLKY